MVQIVALNKGCPVNADLTYANGRNAGIVQAAYDTAVEDEFVAWHSGPFEMPDSLFANGPVDQDCPVAPLAKGRTSGVGYFNKSHLVRMFGMIERFLETRVEFIVSLEDIDLFAMYWSYETKFRQQVGKVGQIKVQEQIGLPPEHFEFEDETYHLYLEVDGSLAKVLDQMFEHRLWKSLHKLSPDHRALIVVRSDDPDVIDLFAAHPKRSQFKILNFGRMVNLMAGAPYMKEIQRARTKYQCMWSKYGKVKSFPSFERLDQVIEDPQLNRRVLDLVDFRKPFVLFQRLSDDPTQDITTSKGENIVQKLLSERVGVLHVAHGTRADREARLSISHPNYLYIAGKYKVDRGMTVFQHATGAVAAENATVSIAKTFDLPVLDTEGNEVELGQFANAAKNF